MGNSNKCNLSQEQIVEYMRSSVFTGDEIRALWFHFKTINSSSEFINRKQFQSAMLFKDSALLDRIFRVFDVNDDDQISFQEYVTCLSMISSKAPKEDKIKFSFQIYDFDGDQYISVSDLTAVVAATLREHQIVITRADIDHIVARTMEDAKPAHPGMISFAEYKTLIADHPNIMAQLTINISGIIAQYTKNNTIALTTPRGYYSALDIHNASDVKA